MRIPDEQDLLWGHTGGGGGNFGIVTKLFFRDLPAAPETAYLWSTRFDWSTLDQASFRRFVQNYGNFMAEHSGVDSPYKGLFPLLALNQKAAGHLALTAQYVGNEPYRLEEFAQAVSAGLPSPSAKVTPGVHYKMLRQTAGIESYPWLTATENLSGSGPSRRGKYKSAYMIEPFPDEQIEVIYEHLANPSWSNASALLQVDGYGGQVNAVDPAATAVPQRSSVLKLQYQAYWTDPADDEANLEWMRSFYTAMYGEAGPVPDGVMDGCYVNYPDADLRELRRALLQGELSPVAAGEGAVGSAGYLQSPAVDRSPPGCCTGDADLLRSGTIRRDIACFRANRPRAVIPVPGPGPGELRARQ